MPHSRTLASRFGTLCAFILVVVAGVCAVLWLQLRQIRTDSARVMEETREVEVLFSVRYNLASALASQAALGDTGDEDLTLLRSFISLAAEALRGLRGHPGDPSRKAHQETENRLSNEIAKDLQRLEVMLQPNAARLAMEPFAELLTTTASSLDVVHREALDEVHEADSDLEHRISSIRRVMFATVLAALLLLGLVLGAVHSGVVRPLQVLHDGAERYGRGELGHRIQIRDRGEIGDLAGALNGMAARLADAQEHLEERVRRRTRQFIRAARLADLGILASGVAHEVNTPLASILSCAEGLQRRLRQGHLSDELLEDYSATITREVLRARTITTRMLALARQEPSQEVEISLQLILDQARSALGYKADNKHVALFVVGLEEDVMIHVDGVELVQILVNLLSNAIDASAPGEEVFLRVKLENESLSLEVEDSGPGIPEGDLERVLEPFFTTKDPDEGTGLGLALVNTLVESHRGNLSIINKPSGGALFRVRLPRDWRKVS